MTDKPAKLNLIVHSGDFDKAHYALAMAAAALAVNIPVTLFFTMHAIKVLKSGGWDGAAASDGRSAEESDHDNKERGVAGFGELLEACRDLGAVFMVCEMGLHAVDLAPEDLRDDITFQQGGLVTFYLDAGKDGQIVFI